MSIPRDKLEILDEISQFKTPTGQVIFAIEKIKRLEAQNQQQIAQISASFDQAIKDIQKSNKAERQKLASELSIALRKAKGDKGDKGDKGPKGDRGPQGKAGKDGRDAEITEDFVNELLNTLNEGIDPIVEDKIATFIPNLTLDASQVSNIEDNINITKVNVSELRLDASQVDNLPRPITQVVGGGTGLHRVTSDGANIKQGVTHLNFDSTFTLTPTPNGVSIAGGGGGGLSKLDATGTVDGSNTAFTFTSAPTLLCVDGVIMQKTSSDGTANWTGTTSVTLTVAPLFDIFGL